MGRTARRRNKRKNECFYRTNEFMLFTKWLLTKGWQQTTKLKMKQFTLTGRGFMAMKPIKCGDVVVRIPKELVITAKTVEDSGIGYIFLDKQRVPIHLVLTTFLVHEKHTGDKSDWYRYISVLPDSYSSPIFSAPEELEHYPTFLLNKVEIMRSSIQQMYQMLLTLSDFKKCKHCKAPLSEIFSYSSFQWAWFTVNSRAVYISPHANYSSSIPILGDNSMALVPYLDMLNHSNDSRVSAEFSFDRGYELKTFVSCKKYEQIFIHYGSHDNVKLFLEYGFIVPKNLHDTVAVSLCDVFDALTDKYSANKKLSNDHVQNLINNLYCTCEGLSWNCKVLIYLLTTDNFNIKAAIQNVYTGSISSNDLVSVARIEKVVISKKTEEINTIIQKLNLQNCVTSSIAKSLFQSYLAILNEAIIAL